MVYTWYIHGIFHVYAILIDMSGIYLVKNSWVCSVPFFIMIYRGYTMNILEIFNFLKLDLIAEYLLLWSVTLLQFTLEELPWCMRIIHVLLTAGSCYGPKKAEAGQELAAYYNHSNAGVLRERERERERERGCC